MKRTKIYVMIAVIIAVLILGIGYAAISNITLNINGTASATTADENFKVKFDGTVTPTSTVPDGVEGATATGTITNDTTATIAVSGLTTKDQTATVTYTILNDSPELSANLAASVKTNNNDEYFDVTTSLAKTTLAKGETTTLTVTVKLKKTPIADQTTNITVGIEASPVVAN